MNKVLENKFMKQQEEIDKRAQKVFEILGIKKLEEVMNTRNQHLMTTIQQFLTDNEDIPRQVIWDKMQQLKYVEFLEIDNNENRAIISIKPHTDIYLKPTIIRNGYLDYSYTLVISNEAVEVLQKFCNDYRLKKEGE